MMISKGFRILAVSLALFTLDLVVWAQTTSGAKCPPVTPKNPQEAVMMVQTSNKQGCWVRDKKTSQLVFLSNLAPAQNYNPILNIPKSSGCKPLLRTGPASAIQSALPGSGLAGTWNVTSGVWPGEGELALARQFGKPGEIQIINNCPVVDVSTSRQMIVRTPNGTYCSGSGEAGLCLNQAGPGSYFIQSGTNRCNYELDGNVLRGACMDSAVPGRVELVVATKLSP